MGHTNPILVVDDDAAAREHLRELLEAAGHSVVQARDGNAALGLMVGTSGTTPALIILDLVMPGLGGLEFLDVLKSYVRLARIPVIIVSGYSPAALNLEDGRIATFLQKPVDPSALLAAVREHLEGPQSVDDEASAV